MKIIEGMKEVKRLEEKIADLVAKIGKYCADRDFENPTYADQKGQINSWLQSVHDTMKDATSLKLRIQKTNLGTIAPIELGGQKVEHSIAEWIIRRRSYADLECRAWSALTNKGFVEGMAKSSAGDQVAVKVRLYFDPLERDTKVELYRGEPGIIDRSLEVVNATTDLLE